MRVIDNYSQVTDASTQPPGIFLSNTVRTVINEPREIRYFPRYAVCFPCCGGCAARCCAPGLLLLFPLRMQPSLIFSVRRFLSAIPGRTVSGPSRDFF